MGEREAILDVTCVPEGRARVGRAMASSEWSRGEEKAEDNLGARSVSPPDRTPESLSTDRISPRTAAKVV